MKRPLLAWVLGFCSLGAMAQRSSVDADQLSALQLTLVLLEKGHSIARSGTRVIQSLQAQEYSAHNVHFASLMAVNPAIMSSPEVNEILSIQAAIGQQLHSAAQQAAWSEGEADLQALQQVLSQGVFSMTDDERLAYIHALVLQARDRLRLFLN